ncbi:MAG: dienelactone hydrolase family protein [Leptolyngbyaceae cyanobacterium SM1_1_3]|nr:dienelactone hydrolase family protein [Leptolyngbyaceae cyanobacterium SM1_1_3]NJM85150.1 dienelactone hydrolase family protein [Leptolyngbyaceae cyanobacterium RM2_2_21]NJN04983.1 dienelactone hydrolase family protein [Leptolyngbyaceae cyanobacterium RM1_1_2]
MRLRSLLTALFSLTLFATLLFQACSASDSTSREPGLSDRMAVEHQDETPVATDITAIAPAIPVTTETVTYATVDGEPVTGYLAKPEGAESRLPAIIAIHEWWGLNDNIRAVSARLAGEGYTVLAVDLYNNRVAENAVAARKLVGEVEDNPESAEANLKQAYDYLVNEQAAIAVGSVGWCFGGGWSLQTGLLLPEQLDALAIYYGRLVSEPEQLAPLQMPIAGFFGANDRSIPVDQVRAFESALQSLDKAVEIYIYENAGHAFANPSGERYVPEAAADAWAKTTEFFAQTLKAAA